MKLAKVEDAMRRFYHALGLRMPPVVVASDLLSGYSAARGSAWGILQEAGRDIVRESLYGGIAMLAQEAV